MNLTGEIWKPIAGYEGVYEISSLGRVKSLQRTRRCGRGARVFPELILKSVAMKSKTSPAYLCVSLSNFNKVTWKLVHHLVALAFLGPCPSGKMVLHKNDDKNNNRADNLYHGTAKQNRQDQIINGVAAILSAKARLKLSVLNRGLSDSQVKELRRCWQPGDSLRNLAQQFGVSTSTIHNVVAAKGGYQR